MFAKVGFFELKHKNTSMRIFLIGFMGSGKSYVGARLAKMMTSSFIDLDDWIEKKNEKTINQIFAEEGEKQFRLKERESLHDMARFDKTVIACGGGTPCYFDNIEWMNNNGLTIFLDIPRDILFERLCKKKDHRPLIKTMGDKALMEYIAIKLEERLPHYNMAEVVFTWNSSTVDIASELFGQYIIRFLL